MWCLCNLWGLKHKQPLVPTDGEEQFVMWVLLSLLAPGCQTQPGLTEVTRQQPSSQPRPSAHLCLHWRLSSEGSWEPTLTEEAALKWAPGHRDQVSPDSHVLTVTSTATESRYGMTVTRREASDENKQRDVWLVACMSLGRTLTPVCHPSLTVRKRMRTAAYAHRGVILLSWPSALSHTQISIWVKVASLPNILYRQAFSYAHWNASRADYIVILTSDTIQRNYN